MSAYPIILGVTGLDKDAALFINAASITNFIHKKAINQFVIDLKAYGIWSKFYAIYPFVGGTSSTHKWNLKNPTDSNAAFRLVFSGGITHSSNGALPNGTTGFADTFLNPNVVFPNQTSAHLAFYSRTNTAAGNKEEIGADTTGAAEAALIVRFTGDVMYPIWGTGGSYPNVSNTDSRGFFQMNRTNSSVIQAWKNGVKQTLSLSGNQTGALASRTLYLFAQHQSTTQRFSDRESAFASIGLGMSDTEAANFHTAVLKYETALGRNV